MGKGGELARALNKPRVKYAGEAVTFGF